MSIQPVDKAMAAALTTTLAITLAGIRALTRLRDHNITHSSDRLTPQGDL